jgi:hypothetical protein
MMPWPWFGTMQHIGFGLKRRGCWQKCDERESQEERERGKQREGEKGTEKIEEEPKEEDGKEMK